MKSVEIVKAMFDAGYYGVVVCIGGMDIVVKAVGDDRNYPYITGDGEEWSDTNDFGDEYPVKDLVTGKTIVGFENGSPVFN